ncbi:MAG: hypothetical protein IV090_08230 [Candidatus Sericytochromatia bacterium]|nr:hypothetical protein [Candidatus Sericytochromatia bacterium]
MAEAPHDVVVSQDGTQLYALANQQLYRIETGKASLLKNNQGQCLGFTTSHLEMDSNGTLFLATSWEYENKYQGVRIYKTKPDLNLINVWGEYNSHLVPTPEATPPGNKSSAVNDLYISSENQICISWKNEQGNGLFNDYQFFPFSSTGSPLEPYVLRYIDGKADTGPVKFVSTQVPIVYHDNLKKPLIIGSPGTISAQITYAESILFSETLKKTHVIDARIEKISGNLIIIDQHRLIRMDIETKKTTPIAGHESEIGFQDGKNEARFNQPMALDLDAAGNIYLADSGNRAIRKITPDGTVSTLYRAPTPSASP